MANVNDARFDVIRSIFDAGAFGFAYDSNPFSVYNSSYEMKRVFFNITGNSVVG